MAIVFALAPSRSSASAHHTSGRWTASAALFTTSHGRWHPTTSVASLGELRGVLTVHGSGLVGSRVTATMSIMHLSWQGFTKVILPPTITVQMRRVRASNGMAELVAEVQIPTLLPVYWSIVRFAVRAGHTHQDVQSGVMVGDPAKKTASNTLTIPQARSFCAARPPLPYLRYAVYLHGYFEGIPTGGDGPPVGIILDRPRRVTPAVLRTRSSPHGILTGGFGLPRDGWGTTPGFLACGHRKSLGFGANP